MIRRSNATAISISTVLLGLALPRSAGAAEPAPGAPQPAQPAGAPVTVEVNAPRTSSSYASRVQETATRGDATVADVPQSITVVNRQLMDDVGARRTDDVLPLVPGVQLFSGYGGTWDDYTIRGFHVWSAMTFRDGFRTGYSGANAVDAVNVERVEVLRGPAAALYGPGLPGGSINFITKRPLEERRFMASVTAGSFDTYRGEVDATGPATKDLRYRITASGDTTTGYRDFNDFRRWLVNPVAVYDIGRGTSVLVEAQAYATYYRADPSGVPSINGDPLALPVSRSYTEPALPIAVVRGQLARVEMTHSLSADWSLRIATETKLGHYDEETIFTAGAPSPAGTLGRSVFNWDSSSADTSVHVEAHGTVHTGSIEQSILAGTDASEERVVYDAGGSDPAQPYPIDAFTPQYGAAIPAAPLSGGPSNSWSYRVFGVYANDAVTLLPGLKASVGARVDAYGQTSVAPGVLDSTSDTAVSPRAALLYRPIDALTLFVNANRGYWPSLGIQANGHLLQPEHSMTYEAGARYMLREEAATIDLAVFRLDNQNIAVIDPANPNFQVNRGEAVSRGVEVAATGRVDRRVRVFGSYTLMDAQTTVDTDRANVGKPLPFAAKHAGGFWAQGSLRDFDLDGPALGLGGVYTSERALLDHSTVPGFVRFDAALLYRLGALSLTARVQNLLDTRYVRGGNDQNTILPGAPRAGFVTLGIRAE